MERRCMSMGAGKISFVGLGNMGMAMATNVLKARGSAFVYDVSV